MPGITALVAAISTNLNAALNSRGLPVLQDGAIVIGKVRVDETVAPPRVVMVPRSMRFGPREQLSGRQVQTTNPANPGAGVRNVTMQQFGGGYSSTPIVTFSPPQVAGGVTAQAVAVVRNGSIAAIAMVNAGVGYTAPPTVTITDSTGVNASAVANLGYTLEQIQWLVQQAFLTEIVTFDVYVWGIATPPGSDPDFDATQVLYHQLITSGWDTSPGGAIMPTRGVWSDAAPDAGAASITGHEVVLQLEVKNPVLRAPLPLVPPDTQAVGSATFTPAATPPDPPVSF